MDDWGQDDEILATAQQVKDWPNRKSAPIDDWGQDDEVLVPASPQDRLRSDLVARSAQWRAADGGDPVQDARVQGMVAQAQVKQSPEWWAARRNEAVLADADPLAKAPVLISEPYRAVASAATSIASTVARPFSKDAADYLAKTKEDMGRVSEAARADDWSPWLSRMYGGAAESLAQSGIAAATGAGAAGIIGSFALTEGNQALYDAEQAGLKGADRIKYAVVQGAIEGTIAAAFQRFAPGLENFVPQIAKGAMKLSGAQFLKMTAQEVPEELLTELGHAVAEASYGIDPNATSAEQIVPRMVDTIAQTVGTLGLAQGAARLAQNKQRLEQLETLRTVDSRDLKREASKLGIEGTRSQIRQKARAESKQIQKEIERAQEVQPQADEVREDDGKRTWEQTGQGAAKDIPPAEVLDPLADARSAASDLENLYRRKGMGQPEAPPVDDRVEQIIDERFAGRNGHAAQDALKERQARAQAEREAAAAAVVPAAGGDIVTPPPEAVPEPVPLSPREQAQQKQGGPAEPFVMPADEIPAAKEAAALRKNKRKGRRDQAVSPETTKSEYLPAEEMLRQYPPGTTLKIKGFEQPFEVRSNGTLWNSESGHRVLKEYKPSEITVVSSPQAPIQPPEAATAAKEPWQMTRKEWMEVKASAGAGSATFAEWMAEVDKQPYHHDAVKKAIAEGKPVPPEVLKDYPDLATQPQNASEPLPAPESTQTAPTLPEAAGKPEQGKAQRAAVSSWAKKDKYLSAPLWRWDYGPDRFVVNIGGSGDQRKLFQGALSNALGRDVDEWREGFAITHAEADGLGFRTAEDGAPLSNALRAKSKGRRSKPASPEQTSGETDIYRNRERKSLRTNETSPGKKGRKKPKGEPQTLEQAIYSLGGLDPKRVKAGGVNIYEDLKQAGVSLNVFKNEGGGYAVHGLDTMAKALESAGYWKAPEGSTPGDALLQALKDKAKTFTGMEKEIEQEYAEYQARIEQEITDAREQAGITREEAEEAVRAGARDGLSAAEATEGEAAEVLGEVDDSFDFGANVKPSIAGEQQGLFEKESQGSLFNVSRSKGKKTEKAAPQRSELEKIEDELKAAKTESLPGQKTMLQQAADDALADARAEAEKLRKKLGGDKLFSNPMLDPELVAGAATVVYKYAKAAFRQFEAFTEQLASDISQKFVDDLLPVLKAEWNKLHAKGEFEGMTDSDGNNPVVKKPAEPAKPAEKPAGPRETTGTKNVKTDELRELVGLEARPPVDPESVEEWQEKAAKKMAADPQYAGKLAEELAAEPRALNALEETVLGRHLRELKNRRQEGEDVSDELRTAIEADERVGTIWGRSGVARQVELAADFSVEGLIRQHLRSVNKAPTDAEMEKYSELADRLEKAEGELREKVQKLAQAEVDLQIAQAKADIAAAKSAPPEKKGTKRQRLQEQASAATAKFREKWAALNMMGIVSDPEQNAEKWDEIVSAAVDVVKVYTEIGVDSFLELLSRLKKDFGKITANQKKAFQAAWDKREKPAATEKQDHHELGVLARKLTRFAVESGITDREEVVDAVHQELIGMGFEVSRSDTMAAISGYGDFRELSKDEVSIRIRGIKGELQQLLKLEDMQAGTAPKKTGVERREPTDEERRLIKLVNEAKKRGGYKVTDPAHQLKTALSAAKTAVRHRIDDLQAAIAKREKIVSGQTKLVPDAELAALQKQRDQLQAEYLAIFPRKNNGMSEASRLKAAEKLLDRRISELKADLAAGNLDPKAKKPPLSSPELDAKRRELELLKATREQARLASPEYQAKEAAKQTENYKKALQKSLALWEQRRADASQGELPPKRKSSPVDNEILEMKYQIEQVKRHAQAEIEEAARAQRGKAGKALGFGGDLLDLSRAIATGYEMSAVLRQGAYYTLGFPRQALPAVLDSARAAFSRRADFAIHDNLMKRPNHAEYVRGGLETTAADGPLSHREEMLRSRIASWLASKEGAVWTLPRWAAEGLLGSERAFRSFTNTMRADLFDYMKASVESSRPGTWSEDDAKVAGNAANAFSGRGTLPMDMTGVGSSRIFYAPRWVWSRAQVLVGQPLWKGDKATRLAVGKVYVRAAVGYAAYQLIRHIIYSLTADDDEHKPEYELDMRSSDFNKMRIGDTRIDSGAGLSQLLVLGARIATGEKKTASGKIIPIRGDDVPYGADDTTDVLGRFLRSKLAPLPSAVLDFMAGKNVVGEKATIGKIVSDRVTPMTWRDIWDAEKELGVKQGTVAAIEAFFGGGVSTYGDRTRFRNADEAGRQEIIAKDLKHLTWDAPEKPAYAEFLTDEQLEKYREKREEKKQNLVVAATHEPKRAKNDKDEGSKSDETFEEAVEKRDKAVQTLLQETGWTYEEAKQLLNDSDLKKKAGRHARLKRLYGVE